MYDANGRPNHKAPQLTRYKQDLNNRVMMALGDPAAPQREEAKGALTIAAPAPVPKK